MIKKRIILTVLFCIAAVLLSVGVTAMHHHALKAGGGHDCKICYFINTVAAVILPIVQLLFIPEIIKNLIISESRKKFSESIEVYSSRAPPFIPA